MKKSVGILFVVSLMAAPCFSQFKTPVAQEVNQVKNKALLVETQEYVTRTLMDLENNPDAQQRYKNGVDSFNSYLKYAVDKFFKWSKKPAEYMPASKVAALLRDGKAIKYVILHYTVEKSYVNPLDIGPVYGGEYNDSARTFSKSKGYGVFSLEMPGNDNKTEDIYTVAMPVAYPSEADMIYAIQMMHNVFTDVTKIKDYDIKDFHDNIIRNKRFLKKRTLLVAKSQVSGKTTLQELKEGYDWPIKIVDYKTIDEAVRNSDSAYAYIEVVPLKASAQQAGRLSTVLRDLVIDAKDGKVLGSAKPGRMDREKVADDITKRELSEMMER